MEGVVESAPAALAGPGADATDDAVTMIDVKEEEESNSSVDSFISAADAAELNEKLNAAAATAAKAVEEEKRYSVEKGEQLTTTKPTTKTKPTSLNVTAAAKKDDSVKTATTTAKIGVKSARES